MAGPQPLTTQDVHGLRSPAGLLAGWWQGLLYWLPPSLRAHWSTAPRRVLLHRDGVDWHARADAPGGALANTCEGVMRLLADHAGYARWLVLDPAAVLSVPVSLPLSTADYLRQVLRLQIDRLTPFTEPELAWDARIEDQDPERKSLQARLVALPHARLDAMLDAFAVDFPGAPLHGVDVSSVDGTLGVNLLPPVRRAAVPRPWLLPNLLLAALAVALMAAGLWRSVDNARVRANATQAEANRLQEQARLASMQQQRLQSLVAGVEGVLADRARRPDVIQIVDALAERLPSDVHVERLSLQGTQLQLTGLGSDAATVISHLKGVPEWGHPTISGAMTTNPLDGRERFSITLPLNARGAAR